MKIIFKIPHFQNKFLTKNLQKKKLLNVFSSLKNYFYKQFPTLFDKFLKINLKNQQLANNRNRRKQVGDFCLLMGTSFSNTLKK